MIHSFDSEFNLMTRKVFKTKPNLSEFLFDSFSQSMREMKSPGIH